MKARQWLAALLVLAQLTACNAPPAPPPGVTASEAPPSEGMPPEAPLSTPARAPLAAISAENLAQLTPLYRLGHGRLHQAAYTPDSRYLLAAFDAGVGVYRTADLVEAAFNETPFPITALAIDRDGQRLALGLRGGKDMPGGRVQIWQFDPAQGRLGKALGAPSPEIDAFDILRLAFSPNGQMIAAASSDQVRVWLAADQRWIFPPDGAGFLLAALQSLFPLRAAYRVPVLLLAAGSLGNPIQGLEFSYDSSHLLWRTSIDAKLARLRDGKIQLSANWIEFVPGSRQVLYSTSPDKYYKTDFPTLDAAIPAEESTLPKRQFLQAAVSADARLLAYSGLKTTLWLSSLADQRELDSTPSDPQSSQYAELAFSSDGAWLAARRLGNNECGADLYGIRDDKLQPRLKLISLGASIDMYASCTLLQAPDASSLVLYNDNQVGLWRLQARDQSNQPRAFRLSPLSGAVRTLAFSSAGQPGSLRLAVGMQGYQTALYNLPELPGGDNQPVLAQTFDLTQLPDPSHVDPARLKDGIAGLAFLASGQQLAAASARGGVYSLPIDPSGSPKPQGSEIQELLNLPVEVYALAAAPSQDVLAAGSFDNQLRLLPLDPAGLPKPQGSGSITLDDRSAVVSLAYTPDGSLLAAGTDGGKIRLWQTPDYSLLNSLDAGIQAGAVLNLAITADGKTLLSLTTDGRVNLWRLDGGALLGALPAVGSLTQPGGGPAVKALSLAVHPAGPNPAAPLAAVGYEDGSVHLWSLPDVKDLGAISAAPNPAGTNPAAPQGISALAFSPDGAWLAAGDASGIVTLWGVSPDEAQPYLVQPKPASALRQPTAAPPPGAPTGCTNQARFLADLSLPDGSLMLPSSKAVKVWKLLNTGDCAWNPAYRLELIQAESSPVAQPLGPPAIQFPAKTNTSGGESLVITATLTAPANAGLYHARWRLVDPDGTPFNNTSLNWLSVEIQVSPANNLRKLPAAVNFLSKMDGLPQVWRLEADGVTARALTQEPSGVDCLDVSPRDGSLAYLVGESLVVAGPDGQGRRVLLPLAGCPVWSPDGSRIAYQMNGVKTIALDSGKVQTLLADNFAFGKTTKHYQARSWSPDGARLLAAFTGWEDAGLSVLDLASGKTTYVGLDTSVNWSEGGAALLSAQPYEACYYGSLPELTRYDLATGERESLISNLEGQPTILEYPLAAFQPAAEELYYFLGVRKGQACSDPQDSPNGFAMQRSAADGKSGRRTLNPALVNPQEVLWAADGSLALFSGRYPEEALYLLRAGGKSAVILPASGWDLHWAH